MKKGGRNEIEQLIIGLNCGRKYLLVGGSGGELGR